MPSVLLQIPVPCSPCRQLTCPFHLECLDVAPVRLARAALRLAAPNPAARSTANLAPLAPAPDVPASDPDPSQEDRWPHAPAHRIA